MSTCLCGARLWWLRLRRAWPQDHNRGRFAALHSLACVDQHIGGPHPRAVGIACASPDRASGCSRPKDGPSWEDGALAPHHHGHLHGP